MKKFDIITEADARVLERGASVQLASGGHITPLARDTLNERRITVMQEGQASDADRLLVPIADVRSLAIGSDHAGGALRRSLVPSLRGRGLAVHDLGTDGTDPVDYPDIAARVAHSVARHEADAGIVIDASGIGSAIAANKVPGIRAMMANSETIARYGREHYGANVLTLGAMLVTAEAAGAIVTAWLSASMRDPNAIRRLAKIHDLERSGDGLRGHDGPR